MYFSVRSLPSGSFFLLIRREKARRPLILILIELGKFVSARTSQQRKQSDGQAFKPTREAACAPQIDADASVADFAPCL